MTVSEELPGLGAAAGEDQAQAQAQDQTLAISVSEALGVVDAKVKSLPRNICVLGEISGFRGQNARSGHCYFQLKDERCSMEVMVPKGVYDPLRRQGIMFRDGLQVLLFGYFDLWKTSGRLSFKGMHVELYGEGYLRQQVAELARRLEAEGLMDPARKRPIPAFCSRVCVVTSLSGSVIEDVKRTLARRNPLVEVDVVGCGVQGKQAPATIVRALGAAAASRPDAILLVRGGGSFEDLMCFNDESVARAIVASPVPVITGIGHEPDTSIADMVADRRTSTPTAAAESVAPGIDDVQRQMIQRQVRLGKAMQTTLEGAEVLLGNLDHRGLAAMEGGLSRLGLLIDQYASRGCLQDPTSSLRVREADVCALEQRLGAAMPKSLERRRQDLGRTSQRLDHLGRHLTDQGNAQLARYAASLDALSPLKVLSRGYAITKDEAGHVVKGAGELSVGQEVQVQLGQGSFGAQVVSINE